MTTPQISVLLPVHNARRYVGLTIQSILDQTFTDWELLVIDDGSTDRSDEVITRSAGVDPRIRFWRQSNAGFAVTLNRMIDQARGEFLARIDADDIAMPVRLGRQIEHMRRHADLVVLGSAVLTIDADGDPYGVTPYPATHDAIQSQLLAGRGGIIHPSTMLRRDAVLSVGGYATDLPVVEDQDLWLRLAKIGRLANLDEALTKYRVHPGNMSFERQRIAVTMLRRVLIAAHAARGLPQPVFNDSPGPTAMSDRLARWDRRRTWAWTAVAQGHLKTAWKHAWRLTLQRPHDVRGWKLLIRTLQAARRRRK